MYYLFMGKKIKNTFNPLVENPRRAFSFFGGLAHTLPALPVGVPEIFQNFPKIKLNVLSRLSTYVKVKRSIQLSSFIEKIRPDIKARGSNPGAAGLWIVGNYIIRKAKDSVKFA